MGTVLSVIYALLIAVIFYVLLKERRDPAETLAWILIILVIPVGGMLAYMLFGRSWRKSRQFSYDDDTVSKKLRAICSEQLKELSKPDYAELVGRNFVTLLLNNGEAALTLGNRLRILNNGRECFPVMFSDLRNASRFIHIEVFGIESGELFEQMFAILSERAAVGVEVRVIFDSVGSRALKLRDVERMREAGIEACSYMPVWLPHFANKFNYRNHRKIVVIDGQIGYT